VTAQDGSQSYGARPQGSADQSGKENARGRNSSGASARASSKLR